MQPAAALAPLLPSDEEHLRLLSIFHLVVGILTMLFGCFPLIHLVLGLVMIFNPTAMTGNTGEPPPAFLGWFFVGIAVFIIGLFWTLGILTIVSGRHIKRRTKRMFSLVVAGLNCVLFPFGTALGVFTFVVLGRPSVLAAYGVTPRVSV